jgi:hypothetical protein
MWFRSAAETWLKEIGQSVINYMEDWENIPKIIPETFAVYARQIESLQRWVTEHTKEKPPSVIDRSPEVEARLMSRLEERYREQSEKLETVTKELKDLTASIEVLKKPPQIVEAMIQTEMSASVLDKNEDLSETEHSEDEDASYRIRSHKNSHDVLEALMERRQSVTDTLRPRMYSVDEIRGLFYKYLHRSKLKTQVVAQAETAQTSLKDQIEDQEFRLNKIVEQFQLEVKRIYEKVDFEHTALEAIAGEVNKQFKTLQDWSAKVEYRSNDALVFAKSVPDLQLKLENTIERIERLTGVVTQTQEKITETSKGILDRAKNFVEESEQHTKAELASLEQSLAANKLEVVELMRIEHAEVQQMLEATQKDVDGKIQDLIEDTRNEMQQQMADYRSIAEGDIEKYFQTGRKEQFEITDQAKAIQKEFNKVKRDHEFWRTNVLEPSQVTAARLFTVEARVKEEGLQRIETEQYLKDALKKLLFTLEQAQLNALAAKEIESDQNLTVFLKRLSFVKKLMDYTPAEIRPLISKSRKLTTRKAVTAGEDHIGSSFMTQPDFKGQSRS